jgi:histidinol-phosphate/aromatic aminotransferase/cobyric acid decarboxylase-like protein
MLRHRDVALIVDESFIDFAPPGASVLDAVGVEPNLLVLKGLGKQYGLGGVRVGFLAGTHKIFHQVKNDLPNWNVNGVAEAVLRIAPRYQRAVDEACKQVRLDTLEFYELLAGLPGTTVVPPSGNFVCLKLPKRFAGRDVARRLLDRYGILIKDCAGKSMREGDRWIRVSSRTPDQNRMLVECLAAVLEDDPGPVGRGADRWRRR